MISEMDMLPLNGFLHFLGLKSPAGVRPEVPRRSCIRLSRPAEATLIPEAIEGRRRSGASESTWEKSEASGEATVLGTAAAVVGLRLGEAGAVPSPRSRSGSSWLFERTAVDSAVGSAWCSSSSASSSSSARWICFLSWRYCHKTRLSSREASPHVSSRLLTLMYARLHSCMTCSFK